VDVFETISLDLMPGQHRLTFTIDQTQRSEPLEVEIITAETTAIAAFQN
jgi:hypothetical protein